MIRSLVVAALLAAAGGGLQAQEREVDHWARIRGPVWSSVLAGAVAATPIALSINDGAPGCAPCPLRGVPSFDRWTIRPPVDAWSLASDALLVGLGGGVVADLARGHDGWRRSAAAIESAAWAFALTQVTKAVVARKRPVLYTEGAAAAAGNVDAQRSFPSGHTSVAFAIATTYWLDGAGRRTALHWLALGGAAAIGGARVAAAQHFPSDVFAGAFLGAGTALLVHEIRF